MTTEQLAIVVTGAVGLGAPTLAALLALLRERQQAKRERVARDLDDLRALLDGLLPIMFGYTQQLIALEWWLRQSSLGLPHAGTAPKLSEAHRELYACNARLVIRCGRDSKLVKAFGVYLKLTDESRAEMDRLSPRNEPFDYSDQQLEERSAGYWQAYEDFADVCKTVVGSSVA